MSSTAKYVWPAGALALLRELAAEGHSASAILQRLPPDGNGNYCASKNSVISKCHKLDILLTARAGRYTVNGPGKSPRKRGQTRELSGSAAMKGAPRLKPGFKLPKEPPPPDMPDTEHRGAYAILGLDAHSCHWPVGDPKDDEFRFCCAPMTFGETYCAHHKALSVDAARMKRTKKVIAWSQNKGPSRFGRGSGALWV